MDGMGVIDADYWLDSSLLRGYLVVWVGKGGALFMIKKKKV